MEGYGAARGLGEEGEAEDDRSIDRLIDCFLQSLRFSVSFFLAAASFVPGIPSCLETDVTFSFETVAFLKSPLLVRKAPEKWCTYTCKLGVHTPEN